MDNLTNGMKLILLVTEVMVVFSAFIVAFHPNILYAAVFLLFTFMGVAVMFVYASADFLAGAQVLIYVGGITILVLFAIMLTQWLYKMKLRDVQNKMLIPVVLLACGLAPFLFKGLDELSVFVTKVQPEGFATFAQSPKTALIGVALLNQYLLPFEAITILLLGALVGAVWLARPE